MALRLEDLSVPAPDPGPHDWNDEGVVILKGVLPEQLVADYMAEWREANGLRKVRGATAEEWPIGLDPGTHQEVGPDVLDAERPGGWPDVAPYMRHQALMSLVCQGWLADELQRLIGEPAGCHLNLSGWVSTQRDWHQDGYLNPPTVGDAYAAVWMALEDIDPRSGVFQYIPGSHRWHRLVRSKFASHLDLSDPAWPAHSEAILTPLVEAEAARREVKVVSYVPEAGDVLIWHPRLYHRGSAPAVANAYRPALIAHYSGIKSHHQLGKSEVHPLGGRYWPIENGHPV